MFAPKVLDPERFKMMGAVDFSPVTTLLSVPSFLGKIKDLIRKKIPPTIARVMKALERGVKRDVSDIFEFV
jgi:hypothetical protein